MGMFKSPKFRLFSAGVTLTVIFLAGTHSMAQQQPLAQLEVMALPETMPLPGDAIPPDMLPEENALVPGSQIPALPDQPGSLTESVSAIQDNIPPDVYLDLQNSLKSKSKLDPPAVMPEDMKTVFYTLWQHSLMKEAERDFQTKKPEDANASNNSGTLVEEAPPEPTGPREISLGGISYVSAKRWTVWFNGQRITPETLLPDQMIDMNVHSDFIEIKWFDDFTNLVFPIRLRPHQRFNLDSKMFLPGVTQ
jgi:hypothetical protein